MTEVIVKKVNELKFDKKFYPREQPSSSKIKEYSEILELLPPITINQDNIILDGVHRWFAHQQNKIESINTIVIETKDDDDILLKSTELNSKHGYQLTQSEKKNHVIYFYEKILNLKDGTSLSYDVERLKSCYSIPASTFSDWTKDINNKLEEQLLLKILDLHLQCKEVKEIVASLSLPERTVYAKIKQIKDIQELFAENPISEELQKYPNLTNKLKILQEFQPFIYNIWNINRNNNSNHHFGNFPQEFMENILYYFTKPFDLVFDPFGGGGTTIDACKKWFRKYYVSDINPIKLRESEIKKHDITTGLPSDLDKIDFTFIDPPYWKQAKGQYTEYESDFSNMSIDTFNENMKLLFKNVYKRTNDNGYMAFVISSTQWPNDDKSITPHFYDLWKSAEEVKFKFNNIIHLPYSTQQYNGNQVNIAKEKKILLQLNRELVVFQK